LVAGLAGFAGFADVAGTEPRLGKGTEAANSRTSTMATKSKSVPGTSIPRRAERDKSV
jgi:hypothetical protein